MGCSTSAPQPKQAETKLTGAADAKPAEEVKAADPTSKQVETVPHSDSGPDPIKAGAQVRNSRTAELGVVLQKTTTDILVKTAEGKQEWIEREDIELQGSAVPDFAVGAEVINNRTSETAVVLQRTTTDLLVKTSDGKKEWIEMEDAALPGQGLPEFSAGTQVTNPNTSESGVVVRRTTTDILVKTADGKTGWHDVEDLKVADAAPEEPPVEALGTAVPVVVGSESQPEIQVEGSLPGTFCCGA
eukprot:TRINITY_DN48821_c0_g1_i1.p1 TRINITY_DN48821_c0_g1~~TRINITY_DN48821_c0_g1_i1.p1  ORF type:complete len:244 (-),score=72.84 TRINITY_DN48821_c0_g1_i1:348-1079(-)